MNNMSAGNERPTIGDNVWIGANSIIFGGISIGNGTTLQEGTVLTRSVPPNCLVKGNPALIVKRGANNEVLLARPEALSTSFAGL
jgi:acetyltransferase-like isoleucine patch superfamily enzyme